MGISDFFKRAVGINSTGHATNVATQSGGELTARQVLNALVNPSGSIASLLIDTSVQGVLRYSPLLSGVRYIGESLASMDIGVYAETDNGQEETANHPLRKVLNFAPNQFQTRFEFINDVIQNAIIRGFSCVLIERNGAGEAANLVLLNTDWIVIKYEGGSRYFEYKSPDVSGIIANSDVLFIPGLVDSGIPKPVIHFASNVVKLGQALEKHGIKYFISGQHSKGHYEVPNGTTPAQYNQVVNHIRTCYQGDENSWSTPVLPYGVKFESDNIPNDSAQFLETRNYQLLECARILRISPTVLYHFDTGGTYSNLEAQNLSEVEGNLQTWLTRFEQEANRKLFTPSEQGNYCIKFETDRLRGDTLNRYTAYEKALLWLSVNEVRALDGRKPIDGGDKLAGTQAATTQTAQNPFKMGENNAKSV